MVTTAQTRTNQQRHKPPHTDHLDCPAVDEDPFFDHAPFLEKSRRRFDRANVTRIAMSNRKVTNRRQ
jgi:hypothetical protein